jgi:hypothetical protein
MNKIQQKVLIFSATIIALIIIFPPYQIKNFANVSIQTGYAFIFSLPEYHSSSASISANINAITLLVEIFSVLVICGLLYLAAKDTQQK